MHRDFCTLFDSNYLFKAVAMYRSLERTHPDFTLTAFCFDDQVERALERMALPHMRTVALRELEAYDSELLSVKDDRTPTEYCWTSTPALPLYMFGNDPELSEVTYIDADLLFFSDPDALIEEMGNASVLITPHRFSPEHIQEELNGIYNVQFLTWRRTEDGMTALQWWHDRCIEWCYYRLEDGKLGDQKYLDDWPERFEGIHVLQHKGGGLAPWNISQYELEKRPDGVYVDADPLAFFHYHRVKVMEGGDHDWRPPGYPITDHQFELIYRPYMEALDAAVDEVRATEPGFKAGFAEKPTARGRLRQWLAIALYRVVIRVKRMLGLRVGGERKDPATG
jgi:hypothetical protein